MKKNALIFVIVMFSLLFTSCQKEENMMPAVTDVEAIRAQLAAVSLPSKEEVQTFLSSDVQVAVSKQSSTLKNSFVKGSDELTLVEIFPLDKNTYEVYDDHAIKNLVYYELGNSYRQRFLTVKQQFTVSNGVVDTTKFTFSYEVGCSYSRYFNFKDCNYINQTIFFFRFDNGRQFAYYGDNSCYVKLPPIAGGKWQISVSYNTDGVYQSFMSEMIDFYGESLINLKFQVKKENTVSIIEIKTSDFLKSANFIGLIGKDEQNNFVYFDYPFSYDESMPEVVSFAAPFDIQRINICGSYGCWSSYTSKLSKTIKDGKIIYRLE